MWRVRIGRFRTWTPWTWPGLVAEKRGLAPETVNSEQSPEAGAHNFLGLQQRPPTPKRGQRGAGIATPTAHTLQKGQGEEGGLCQRHLRAWRSSWWPSWEDVTQSMSLPPCGPRNPDLKAISKAGSALPHPGPPALPGISGRSQARLHGQRWQVPSSLPARLAPGHPSACAVTPILADSGYRSAQPVRTQGRRTALSPPWGHKE